MATDFVITSEKSFDPSTLTPVLVELSDGSRYQAHGFDPSAVQLQLAYMQEIADGQDAAAVLAELRNAMLHTFDEVSVAEILVKVRSALNPVSVDEIFSRLLPKLVDHYEPEIAAYQEEMGLASGNREQRRAAKKTAAKKTTAAKKPATRARS
ncbi:hypothetical protein KVH15_33605 [Streptomyces olivaceus]|uniref:hypothetical protein n=1 Tax=Streptomyces olivaceus TaxID=47716 RepID=UPI001CCBE5F0|nr:hypothetical protein [Streptomyces olivaceus]MBZ6085921.1 hypothetical protein [Streptomyces olivaceus]GHI91748.1 hypothetical protein TPA0905_12190 [Streptomyces olivaceus]